MLPKIIKIFDQLMSDSKEPNLSDYPNPGERPSSQENFHSLLPDQIYLKQQLSKYILPSSINLGNVYSDSVQLMKNSSYELRSSFAAHGFREILEKLPELEVFDQKKPLSLKQVIFKFLQLSKTPDMTVDNLRSAIQNFETEVDQGWKKRATITASLLHALNPSLKPVAESVIQTIVERWGDFQDAFIKIAHLGKHVFEREFSDLVEAFESFLIQIFKPRTFDDFDKLDGLIRDANSQLESSGTIESSLLNQILSCLPNSISGAPHDYFFGQLNNPKWIALLKKKDKTLFQNPPIPIRADNGTIFPEWAQSRYLARIADQDPQTVCALLKSTNDTNNFRVHDDFVSAALKMPTEHAAQIAKLIVARKWIQASYSNLFPLKCAELAITLAKAAKTGVSFSLLETLLILAPPPIETSKPSLTQSKSTATPYINDHTYTLILKEKIPPLVDLLKERVLMLLKTRLDEAMNIEGLNHPPREDTSYIQYPTLHGSAAHSLPHLTYHLMEAVRDSNIKCMAIFPERAMTLIDQLLTHGSGIFKRLALYLASQQKTLDVSLVDRLLSDKSNYEPVSTWGEFSLFLKTHFQRASEHVKNVIFPSILETPIEGVTKLKIWQLRILTLIQEHLTPPLLKLFESLSAECGDVADPDQLFHLSPTWIGPTSPLDQDELEAKSPEQLLSFLKNWTPSTGWFMPSRQGLGRKLAEIIQRNPDKFLALFSYEEHLHPIYQCAVLEGVSNTTELFSWHFAINLCKKITSRLEPEEPHHALDENHSNPSAENIVAARFLQKAFSRDTLPYELRNEIWQTLQPLALNLSPAKEDPTALNRVGSYALCLDTVHGEALQAVMQYALWVRKILNVKDKTPITAYCPEAKEVLERHLDLSFNSQISTRAVYGRWFHWIILLDPDWAKSLVPSVFSQEQTLIKYRTAAWETYLQYCPLYNDAFDLLEDEYRQATRSLKPTDSSADDSKLDVRLCEHLMILYVRDKISFESANSLMGLFFDCAPAELKGRAIKSLGFIIKDSDTTKLPTHLPARLQQLWDARIRTDRKLSAEEFKYIGWWVVAQKLEPQWIIDALSWVVGNFGKVEPTGMLFTALESYSAREPERILMFCEKYAKKALKTDPFFSHADDFYNLLKSLKAHTNSLQTDRLRDLVNLLGAAGNPNFRSLIE